MKRLSESGQEDVSVTKRINIKTKNMVLYNILSLIAAVLVLGSCRAAKSPTLTRQSKTTIKEMPRDSVVTIPADGSSFRATLSTDETGNTIIKEVLSVHVGKRAKAPQVRMKNQILHVDCVCDSANIYLKWKEIHITDSLSETAFIPVEKELNTWQQVQIWLGRVFLVLFTAFMTMLLMSRKIV
jgi:hypothetical protein